MKLTLGLFMTGLWAMLLAISAFLVLVVAPLGEITNESPRMLISVVQAAVAISAVVLFVVALSRMKRFYVSRKIWPA
jgi:hypothetical protein